MVFERSTQKIESKKTFEQVAEELQRLTVESLNISQDVFNKAGIETYSGQNEPYALMASAILEALRKNVEKTAVEDLAIRSLQIAKDSIAQSQVDLYSDTEPWMYSLLAKSIFDQLISEHLES